MQRKSPNVKDSITNEALLSGFLRENDGSTFLKMDWNKHGILFFHSFDESR